MANTSLFSDSWRLVADLRLSLRPELRLRRQRFGGRLWYVIGDPYAHRYYRISPEAQRFFERLDGRTTVEAAWLAMLGETPDDAPGQQEVLQVLTQFFHAGLLHADKPLESERLFRQLAAERAQMARQRWLQFLFLRIPLWDPNRFLDAIGGLIRLVVSRWGALALAVLGMIGILHLVGRAEDLTGESEGILSASNLAWLYLTWVGVKFFHELGHAVVCKRFGGEVHVMGVMLLVFTPFPYVDASAAWLFRERWKRVLTGCAGMLFECVLGAIAAILWARSGPGVVHQVAYNVMFLATVSTVLFNLNPLLRFDGYYILSDLCDSPNLHQRSSRQLLFLLERHLFGLRSARPVTGSRREAFWLTVFALASGVYRILVLGIILLYLAKQFLGLGIALALFALVLWVVGPLWKALKYLVAEPRLETCRGRALGSVAGILALLLVGLFVVPFPRHFRAPGVVRAEPAWHLLTEVDGRIETIFATPGARVEQGDLLLRLSNPDLADTHLQTQAALAETNARLRLARETQPSSVVPLEARLAVLRRRLAEIEERESRLEVRAPSDGLWSAPLLDQAQGLFVPRGTELGMIVPPDSFRFVAIASQEDASDLFGAELKHPEVRLRGQEAWALVGSDPRIAPAETRRLPTPSLGWMAGGAVEVRPDDPSGRTTLEPHFEISVALSPEAGVRLLHERSGVARFELDPVPLGWQWVRRLHQLFQRRLAL